MTMPPRLRFLSEHLGRVLVALLLVLAAAYSVAAAQPEPRPLPDTLTVEATVERALSTHPAIEAARQNVDAAAARIGQVRSAQWPRVEAVGTYRRQDPVPEISVPGAPVPGGGGGSVGIQPNNLYDGHLRVQQTLYDFGQTAARIDQAKAGRTVARRQVGAERSALAFRAVQAFYTTLLADARLEVQREQIDRLERALRVTRRRRDAGTATAFEVQSTRTRLSAARSRLTRLQSQRQRQEAELHRLLGHSPNRPLSGALRFPLASTDPSQIEVDSLVDTALRQHPTVRMAQARVRAARRQVETTDRSDRPRLALTAQGGVKNGYPGDLNEPRLNESIGLSLRVPLFEGFATQRQVEEAEAEVQAAEARLADARRRVTARVRQAAADLRASLDRLKATAQRVEQARIAADLARQRYEAGTLTNLDLLEAETQLREARLERKTVRYEVVMGWYALQRAAGTLLPFEPPR